MKKISLAAAAVAGALLLAGCQSSASRMYECEASGVSRDACYVAEQNRKAGINAAATKQAMENANDLYGAKGTETNKAKHHNHKRSYQEDEDATDYDDQDVDTGVVYRHGKKGYLNADGEFQQYAQSAHRHRDNTSCKDLQLFIDQGVDLTPAQEQSLSKCRIKGHVSAAGHSKHWSGYGVTVRQDADGLVYVNDHAAAPDEQSEEASVFSSGLYQVIIRTNGKADLLKNGQFVGHLK